MVIRFSVLLQDGFAAIDLIKIYYFDVHILRDQYITILVLIVTGMFCNLGLFYKKILIKQSKRLKYIKTVIYYKR